MLCKYNVSYDASTKRQPISSGVKNWKGRAIASMAANLVQRNEKHLHIDKDGVLGRRRTLSLGRAPKAEVERDGRAGARGGDDVRMLFLNLGRYT